jgi:hypothetical protein
MAAELRVSDCVVSVLGDEFVPQNESAYWVLLIVCVLGVVFLIPGG